MERDAEAMADALATIRSFNSACKPGRLIWFWATIVAALATKHHWLFITCDAWGTVIDFDLTTKQNSEWSN